ncbi:MAG: N-acetylmuramoyl-L-alanine amidase [Opitutus sp.]|nr:N-acetylmuramoyl-L-alanine amidase [Opitutus sp.]
MSPAAFRLTALGAFFLLVTASLPGAQGAATPPGPAAAPAAPAPLLRAAPERPARSTAALASTSFGGIDHVSATDLAVWLGCTGAANDSARKFTLTDKNNPANRAELNADGREALVNGLRVFLGSPVLLRGGKLYVSRIDAERCLAPLLRPAFGGVVPPPPKIIALDPGHGGRDDGTENKELGLKEKTLTLDVSLRLKKLLEAAGYRVVLTRTEDRELSPRKEIDLALRASFANRERADLFVSIHFNAATKDTQGTEVFTYAPRMQHATDWWGQLTRDDPDLETGEQPANRFDSWNVALAAALHRQLLQTLQTEDRGKKIAHWAVLKTLNCPGVLVEPAILSNAAEARRAARPEFRQQVAEALAAGIRDYAATLDSLRPR